MEDKKKKKVVKKIKKVYGNNKKSIKQRYEAVKEFTEKRDLSTPLAPSIMTKAFSKITSPKNIKKYK